MPSEKVLEQKKQFVTELSETLKSAHTGVIVSYKGITVEDDTKLRREIRESGSHYKVVKNTLLRFALKEAGIEGMEEVLKGTTAIAVSKDDYVSPARILVEYSEKHDAFEVKAGFIDGKAASAEEMKKLAKLPSKEILLSQTLRGLNGPISGFVTVLNGTLKSLVIALNAIAEKQQQSA